ARCTHFPYTTLFRSRRSWADNRFSIGQRNQLRDPYIFLRQSGVEIFQQLRPKTACIDGVQQRRGNAIEGSCLFANTIDPRLETTDRKSTRLNSSHVK